MTDKSVTLQALSSFIFLGFVIGTGLGIAIFNHRAALRMQVLANIISNGHQKLMVTTARTTLIHLSEMLEGKSLTPDLCRGFSKTIQESQGFYALLAIGTMDGEPVCTSDATVPTPLPTMKDRSYYERVKEGQGLVVGEYVISKTTGKPTLHYAYPIFDEKRQKIGFVVAAVDLTWFINSEISKIFDESGVEVVGADRHGKVLFMYPSDKQNLGKNSLSASLIAAILRGDKPYIIAQSYMGEYRMYAYQWSNESDNDLVITASVDISTYWYLWLAFGILGAALAWIVAERLLQTRTR